MPPLAIGVMLYGYCNGFFGDSYGPKRVEAFGYDWIVAREKDGTPLFCYFETHWLSSKDRMIQQWMQQEDE